MEEKIHVSQSEGFIVVGYENKVFKLRKAPYGLKQALQVWCLKIGSFFS